MIIPLSSFKMKLFFHKLTHWEYWPMPVVYFPIFFQWLWYAARCKTVFFFNTANPSIKNGGFFMESKMNIYALIPPEFYPKTHLITSGMNAQKLLQTFAQLNFSYPLMVKPDIGLRGSAVQKIESEKQLLHYHSRASFDYLLQDLIPFENEIGVFYVRFPNESKGRITGIVAKELLTVTGDGILNIEQLLQKDPRHQMQQKAIAHEHGTALKTVLPQGEKRKLVPYGNHIRGAKFTDASHQISAQLNEVIDGLCTQIPDFYFGRLDIMFQSWEELEAGVNFQIVELNGSASEPTHIYDPKHSIFFGWRELSRHVGYMFQISQLNHQRGWPYLTFSEGIKQYQMHRAHNRQILNFK